MNKNLLIIVFFLLLSSNVDATEKDITSIDSLKKQYAECGKIFEQEKQKCQESWSMKCFDYLISLNHKTQDCYVNIAKKMFTKFYGQSEDKTVKQMAEYINFMYEQYLFIYGDTNFCKKNNCGISPYLYSEYAATYAIKDYIFKAMKIVDIRQ